jgi:hypothetical protein
VIGTEAILWIKEITEIRVGFSSRKSDSLRRKKSGWLLIRMVEVKIITGSLKFGFFMIVIFKGLLELRLFIEEKGNVSEEREVDSGKGENMQSFRTKLRLGRDDLKHSKEEVETRH